MSRTASPKKSPKTSRILSDKDFEKQGFVLTANVKNGYLRTFKKQNKEIDYFLTCVESNGKTKLDFDYGTWSHPKRIKGSTYTPNHFLRNFVVEKKSELKMILSRFEFYSHFNKINS